MRNLLNKINPFGFQIPNFPKLQIAKANFSIVPLKETEEKNDLDQSDISDEPNL